MKLTQKEKEQILNCLSYMSHQQWMIYAQNMCKEVDEKTREEWKKHFRSYEKLDNNFIEEHRFFAERTLKLIEPIILKKSVNHPKYIQIENSQYLQ